MAADFVYDSEMLPLVITHRTVRRSRCMCLLFLFLIATFVGLTPIMVYRSLGVPLPEGFKEYRNVQPWVIISRFNLVNESSTPQGGPDGQALLSGQQSFQTSTKPRSVSIIPNSHLHPSESTQLSTLTTPSEPLIDTLFI